MIDVAALVNQPMFIWYQYFVNPFYSLPMIHWCALLQSHHYVNNLAPESIVFTEGSNWSLPHRFLRTLSLINSCLIKSFLSFLFPDFYQVWSCLGRILNVRHSGRISINDCSVIFVSFLSLQPFPWNIKFFTMNKIKFPTKFALFTF